MNSGKAGEAWKRFVEQFNRGLLEMINKRFIFGPLANAASGWLNNLFPGGAFASVVSGRGEHGLCPRRRVRSADHVSVCERYRAYGRGRAGSDRAAEAAAERPARHRSHRSRRSAPITVNVINAPAGTQVRERRDPSNGGRHIDVLIDAAVANSLATPGMRGNRTLRAMGGADPIIRR